MKAVLKSSLYRRPKPTNEVMANGHLEKGSVIEVDEVVTGKPIEGLSDWYKAKDGFFYWGGGLNIIGPVGVPPVSTTSLITFPPANVVWLDNFIGIETQLKQFTGNGVKVAIIDTGVDVTHPDISSSIIAPRDFTGSSTPMTDDEGHGTAVAGIIAANTQNQKGVKGLAPGCKIIPIKVIKNSFDRSNLASIVIAAIDHALISNADIINISLDLSDIDSTALRNAMNKAAVKGVVLIASAGDVDELTELGVSYPGRDPNFISIGATNPFFEKAILNKRPQRLDFLGGLKDFWTLSNKSERYRTVNGSSFCAAFLSGLAALIIARTRQNQPGTPIDRNLMFNEISKSISNQADLHQINSFSFIKV